MKRLTGLVVILAVCLAFTVGCANKKASTAKSTASGLQSVYFDFDRSDIKPEYQAVLKNNASWLQANPKAMVKVEGNCDERGTPEYNIALGERRANASAKYLKNLGVPASQISTMSYGEEKPVCMESNESCWWKNRRADFKATK